MLRATASAVANDQVTLYAQLLIAQAQTDTAKAALASVIDPRVRGGLVRIESNVSDEPALTALRTPVTTDLPVQAQLAARGATPPAPPPTCGPPPRRRRSHPLAPPPLRPAP